MKEDFGERAPKKMREIFFSNDTFKRHHRDA
jgi:hypothetical protein